MINDDNQDEYILDYIYGELNEFELAIFEKKRASDSDFAVLVLIIKALVEKRNKEIRKEMTIFMKNADYILETYKLNSHVEKNSMSSILSQKYHLPIKLLVSYHEIDSSYLIGLKSHLSTLIFEKKILVWTTDDILAGQEIERIIWNKLNEVDVVVLLISSDFIGSDFHRINILEAVMQKKMKVIPVYLRPFDCNGLPFSKLETLPNDKKQPRFISSWFDLDEAWLNVVKGIRKSIFE